jgi:hypothetical protein
MSINFDKQSVLSDSDLLRTEPAKGASSTVAEVLHSAAYSMFQAPVSGMAQIIDQVADSQLESATHIMSKPKPTEDPLRWHAQQVGQVMGMIAPVLLIHKGVGAGSKLLLKETLAAGEAKVLTTFGSGGFRSIAESAVTGAVHEGIFRPSETNSDRGFLRTRLNNALTGLTTFGLMSAGTIGLRSLKAEALGATSVGKATTAFLRSELGSAVTAGGAAGFAGAHTASLLDKGDFASAHETSTSVLYSSLLGGVLAKTSNYFSKSKASEVQVAHDSLKVTEPPLDQFITTGLEPAKPAARSTGEISTPVGDALVDYSDIVTTHGPRSQQAKDFRTRWNDNPDFRDFSQEVVRIDRLFSKHLSDGEVTPRRHTKSKLDSVPPPSEPTLVSDSLSNFAEALSAYGPDSAQALAILKQHKHVPEFTELATEMVRLERLARKPTNKAK